MGYSDQPDGKFAYVANYSSNSVTRVDPVTNAITGTYAVGTSPVSIAISPNGAFAYVVNGDRKLSPVSIPRQTGSHTPST